MTRDAHLSGCTTKVGAPVAAGQQIAKMGSTGRSTGSHLHFEVRLNGVAVNPRRFLEAKAMFSKSKPTPDSVSTPSPQPPAQVPAKMATGARHTTFSIIGSDVVITGNVAASVDLPVDGKIAGDRSEEHTSE